MLVLYNSVTVPLDLAYSTKFENDKLNIVNYIVDAFFLFDIIFNFRTTYINLKTGFEVFESKILAKTYLMQSRFYTDLLSVLPFEIVYDIIVG